MVKKYESVLLCKDQLARSKREKYSRVDNIAVMRIAEEILVEYHRWRKWAVVEYFMLVDELLLHEPRKTRLQGEIARNKPDISME